MDISALTGILTIIMGIAYSIQAYYLPRATIGKPMAPILFPLGLGVLMVIFGVVGYFMSKADIPTAPLILAVIVGNSMEQSYRQTMTISNGNYGAFFNSTISIILALLTVLSVVYPFVQDWKKKKGISVSK